MGATHHWFMSSGAFRFAIALVPLACSADPVANDYDAGTAGATAESEDGSEIQSPVDKPTSLELESELDVTPTGLQAHRPDVTMVNGELWLAYAAETVGLQLQRFDTDLNPVGDALDLEDATEAPTDVRVGLANGRFWYAFETVAAPTSDCEHNFLSVAAYSAAEPPVLSASGRHIATGCPSSVEFIQNPSGVPLHPEAVDDPTPFFHHGVPYVLTRAWCCAGVQLHHLRRLDGELAVAEEVLLDSDSFVPDGILAQNTLVHVNGRPFLVGGFPSGPPAPPFTSKLVMVELADDLSSFIGEAAYLNVPNATYPQRVTRARHVNGTLVVNYVDRYAGAATRELLALFDVAGGAFLSEVQVQDHEVVDNHSSFEIVDDRLYLFQQQDGERLSAKVFRLRP